MKLPLLREKLRELTPAQLTELAAGLSVCLKYLPEQLIQEAMLRTLLAIVEITRKEKPNVENIP